MRAVTAAQNLAQARRAAGSLRARGLQAGDRVALLLPGSADLLAAVMGALRIGVVPVMLDPGAPSSERELLLADADAALVIDTEPALARLFDAPPADVADHPLTRPMHYTSGTTGRRKGVHTPTLTEADAALLAGEELTLWEFDADDRHLVFSPMHHSAPLRFALHTLLAGGEVLLPGPFDAGTMLDVIAEHRPTTAFCVPTHLQRLLDLAGPEARPLRGFRMLAHAGAPCPQPLKHRILRAASPGGIWEFYGSTEVQFTVCSDQEWRQRPGTVGRPRPGRELRIAEDDIIYTRVPAYARFGYFRDEAKTAAAWHDDEVTVGDSGLLDDDGFLFLHGRRSDLIISGGVNVYPLEVEEALSGCPGLAEVAVFGVHDPQWGQRVLAAVVGEANEQQLQDWARSRLSGPKRPKQYLSLPELPRTSTGKVRRLDLPDALGL